MRIFSKSNPPPITPRGVPRGEGGYFGGSCVVTTYLELLSLTQGRGELGVFDFKNKNSHPNRVYTPSLSLIALKMWPQPSYPQNRAPLPQGGGVLGGGGLSFWGKWVCGYIFKAIKLKLGV